MPDSVLNIPDDTRMLDVVRRGLASADEVRVAVSFTRCSGLGLLVDPLRELADRGGLAQILTSTYQDVTQPEALATLLDMPRVQTRVQSGSAGFHAKFWWFKGKVATECWAGSSNMTKGGLATNLEWNLRSVESARMEETRKQFEYLWTRPDVSDLSASLIAQYRQRYVQLQRASLPPPFEPVGPVSPNAAQLEALGRLAELRSQGVRRAAVVAATGIGKTLLAAFDVRQAKARNVLFVSHRLEHLLQAERAFRRVFGGSLSLGVVGGGYDMPNADVVFATVASLNRRPELLRRPWDYLVIDEFHHAEASSYQSLRPIRERAFLLGLTATPERQDGHDVLEWCDWNIAYEVRLPQAIERGWLLPFHYFGVADTTVDFKDFPWRRLDQIEDTLSVRARAELVLKSALEYGFDGQKRVTVGFCAGKRHGQFMANTFNELGQSAAFVSGDDAVDDREALYRRLANPEDKLSWLFVSDVLNEGVDLPAINSVLFLRPTESATLFLQQLGRGLRLCPGTEVLTVLDFVGHHRSYWLTLQSIDAPAGNGVRTELAQGIEIRPPSGCEVVLQQRTKEILEKVHRFTSKKDECADAYRRVREELGRPVLPIDLRGRTDVPDLSTFRGAFGSWLGCQSFCDDTPAWAQGLPENHPAAGFLRAVEADWQAQRVAPYALVWGLSYSPEAPERGYEEFFQRWPHFREEYAPLGEGKAWTTLEKKVGSYIVAENEPGLLRARDAGAPAGPTQFNRLDARIISRLGSALLPEVEGRLLYTANNDYQTRHGGVLRTPEDLKLFSKYTRPEIVNYFGAQYDPAKHNGGILWFGADGVIIPKLDTSSAKAEHQYSNRFLDRSSFSWTSQPQMSPENAVGRKVLDHQKDGRRLHLFVKRGSHDLAVYMGSASVRSHAGSEPMTVVLGISEVPPPLYSELTD